MASTLNMGNNLAHWAILRRVTLERNRASSLPQRMNTSSSHENGNTRPKYISCPTSEI